MKKLILALCSLFLFSNVASALVEVDITRGNLDPLPIAVSPLYLDSESQEIVQDGKSIKKCGGRNF